MKKWLTLMALGCAFSTAAFALSAQNINGLIKKNNAGWVARDNHISKLDPTEIRRLLGSKDLPSDNALFEDRSEVPESIDWRNERGVNWLGPVMNQGNCGSCVAFAAIATLESSYRIQSGLPWLMPTFSPQHLFNCGGGVCDNGWWPAGAANMLKNKGVVDAACVPYESGSTGEDIQCKKNFCQNQSERTYKISNYTSPSFAGGTASKVKEALKRGPLLTTLRVYEDFLYYSSGIYKSVSRKSVGGHAVSLVGFNDAQRYWIVRNSWGSDWGENGFIRVSYDDYSGIGNSTWAYQVRPEDNTISIDSLTGREYVSGEKKFKVMMAKAADSELVIQGESQSSLVLSCETKEESSCEVSLDTTNLKDGRYEIYAKTPSVKSQVRELFVVNHEPRSTISFSGAQGIDLKKAQSGRIEFDISVKADPVMPQKITFYVEDSNGQIINSRVTDEVVEKMRLGFRTNTLSNGQYLIYYSVETPYNGTVVKAMSDKVVLIVKN